MKGRDAAVLVLVPPFLGPGFRLGARWNRLVETVKTRKKRDKTGQKWARYGLKRVNKEGTGGINWAQSEACELQAQRGLTPTLAAAGAGASEPDSWPSSVARLSRAAASPPPAIACPNAAL